MRARRLDWLQGLGSKTGEARGTLTGSETDLDLGLGW
jgi:hypothetical protein